STPRAPARHSNEIAIRAGRNFTPRILSAMSRYQRSSSHKTVHSVRRSGGRVQEFRALEQRTQAEYGPALRSAAKRARQITLATHDGRRHRGAELVVRKTAEAQHLVHQQAGGNLAM